MENKKNYENPETKVFTFNLAGILMQSGGGSYEGGDMEQGGEI